MKNKIKIDYASYKRIRNHETIIVFIFIEIQVHL